MRTPLLAVLLSLFVTTAASAAITITFELPTPNQVVGPGPDVWVYVDSTFSLQSVVASVADRSSALTFQSGQWRGFVNIHGLARGTHTLTVTATDVQANTASASRSIVFDNYPVVTL